MRSSDGTLSWLPTFLFDLLMVAGFTAVTALFVFVPALQETLLRPILAFIFVLFVPGYAVVMALFPRKEQERSRSWRPTGRDADDTANRSGIYLELLVLSFGTSVAITIIVGLGLGFTEAGITRLNVFRNLALVTVAFLAIAAVRRRTVRPDQRFYPPVWEAITRLRSNGYFNQTKTTAELALNVALLVAVVLAVTSVGISLAAQQDASLTEFALLTQNDDGEYVASDYPSSLTRGTGEPFAVRIQNEEGETVSYTVVVLLQLFEDVDERGELLTQTRLHQFEATLEDGEAERIDHTITPETSGSNYRLTYLLYRSQPPTSPSIDNAYRELHIWVDIEQPLA